MTEEFRFTFVEKTDRYGEKYLFAGLRTLNAVLFVRRDPNNSDRWFGSLRPYRGPSGEAPAEDFSWEDDLPTEKQETRNPTNKRK